MNSRQGKDKVMTDVHKRGPMIIGVDFIAWVHEVAKRLVAESEEFIHSDHQTVMFEIREQTHNGAEAQSGTSKICRLIASSIKKSFT